jgi:hypothetical protein
MCQFLFWHPQPDTVGFSDCEAFVRGLFKFGMDELDEFRKGEVAGGIGEGSEPSSA